MKLNLVIGSAIALMSFACPKSKFSTGTPVVKPTDTPIVDPPKPVDPPPEPNTVGSGSVEPPIITSKPPIEPSKECFGKEHRALRIAFIVDNSASMSPSVSPSKGQPGYTEGTDPVQTSVSSRGRTENFTRRQDAIHKFVSSTLDKDVLAKQGNNQFLGNDIALSYFPLNAKDDVSVRLSERPPLPEKMNSLLKVSDRLTFLNDFWNILKFTHKGEGRTPYLAALKEAKMLLKDGKLAADTRRDMVVFLTDGLPSDESPSLVKLARQELTDTDFIYLRLYDTGISADDKFKVSLRNAFLDNGVLWARKSNNPDKYSSGDFEKYWKELTDIPGQISTQMISIVDSTKLNDTINQIVGNYQKCP